MSEQPTIKVSALVSTYNSEYFFRSCLENLLCQTLVEQLEIIVIDSGSQENEALVVAEFLPHHPQLKYLRTERETLYAAWNRGIDMAQGEYLINANTDDRLREDAYALLAGALDDNPQVGLVYGDCYQSDSPEDIIQYVRAYHKEEWQLIQREEYSHKKLLLNCLCGPQPMWRRSLHKTFGHFDSTFTIAGDYEFWLRIAEGVPFFHLSIPLGLYYLNRQGLERSSRATLLAENHRIRTRYFAAPQKGSSLLTPHPENEGGTSLNT